MAKNQVRIAIIGDSSNLKRALSDAEKAMRENESAAKRWGDSLSSAGNKILAGSAAAGAALWAVGDAAADLNASVSTSDMVFGKASGSIKEWGEQAADSFGLSSREFHQFANLFGSFFKNMGFNQAQAADMSKQMITLAADMAAAFDSSPQEAVEALTAAMRGEMDPIEKYGVSLREADIKAKMLAMGLDDSTTAAEKHSKAIAVMALIQEQTSSVTGQFAREQDSLSGQMARAKAKFEDARAELGQNLIPIMLKAVETGNTMVQWLQNVNKATSGAVTGIAGTAAATGLLVGSLAKVGGLIGQGIAGFEKLNVKLTEFWLSKSWTVAPRSAESIANVEKRVRGATKGATELVGVIGILSVGFSMWNTRQQELTQSGRDVQDMLNEQVKSGKLTYEKLSAGLDAATHSARDLLKEAQDLRSNAGLTDLDLIPAAYENAEKGRMLEIQMRILSTTADELSKRFGISKDEALAMAGANFKAGRAADDAAGLIDVENEDLKEQKKRFEGAIKAMEDYGKASRGMLDANIAARDANVAFAKSLQENGYTLDINTEKGRANIGVLGSAIEKWIVWGQQQRLAGADAGWVTDRVNEQIGSLRAQYSQTDAGRAVFDLYVASMKATPTDISTQFNVPGLNEAINGVSALESGLARLGNTSASLRAKASQLAAMGQTSMAAQLSNVADILDKTGVYVSTNSPFPGRAVGGSVLAGGSYLVGERGPEVLRMGSRSGKVETMAQAAPFGGGGEERIVLEVDGRVLAEVLRRREVANL